MSKHIAITTITSIDDIKGGYYGTVTYETTIGDYDLYVAEIADPYDNDDAGWECGDWWLVNGEITQAMHIAHCDGYNGVEWQADDAALLAIMDGDADLLEELQEAVTPYEITGELIAAAQAATLEEVAEDYVGEVAIWSTPEYYAGTCNAPTADYVRDGDGYPHNDIMTFASAAEAQAYIDDTLIGDEPYCLSHGEAARPGYQIVKHS